MSVPVAVLMAAMISIVPFYIFIADTMPGRPLHALEPAPALAAGVVAVLALAAACYWIAYRLGAGVS